MIVYTTMGLVKLRPFIDQLLTPINRRTKNWQILKDSIYAVGQRTPVIFRVKANVLTLVDGRLRLDVLWYLYTHKSKYPKAPSEILVSLLLPIRRKPNDRKRST